MVMLCWHSQLPCTLVFPGQSFTEIAFPLRKTTPTGEQRFAEGAANNKRDWLTVREVILPKALAM